MEQDKFESIGKELGLGKNQIKIINALAHGEKNADEISLESSIPRVKIYTFLNELISLSAIKKTMAVPSKYYILSVEDTIQGIMDKKFEEFMDKRAEILSSIENKELKQTTKNIFSEDEYTKILIDIYSKKDPLSIISRVDSFPRFFCPKDKTNYLKHRQKIKKYRRKFTESENNVDKTALYTVYKTMIKKKRPVRQTVSKTGLSNYFRMISKEFGKKELKQQLTQIKDEIEKNNFRIRVINSDYPFNLHVTKSIVSFATICKNSVIGFSSVDKSLISTYGKLFEEEWENGTEFQEIARDYKKWIE